MRKFLLVSVAASVVALTGSAAFADLIQLDQSQTSYDYQARIYSSRQNVCQTFTSGLTGDLVEVSVLLSGLYNEAAPATIRIVGTTGGDNHPDDTNVLWTGGFTSLAQGWFNVDTSVSAPALTAGTVYGIEITCTALATDPNKDYWNYNRASNLYAAGQLWEKTGPTSSWATLKLSGTPEEAPDAAFETYVFVVPEPTTMALLLLGAPLFFVGRIRRRLS